MTGQEIVMQGESTGCVVCGAEPICCSYASYDDGSHDEGRCAEHCSPHHRHPFRQAGVGGYERMDCDA